MMICYWCLKSRLKEECVKWSIEKSLPLTKLLRPKKSLPDKSQIVSVNRGLLGFYFHEHFYYYFATE